MTSRFIHTGEIQIHASVASTSFFLMVYSVSLYFFNMCLFQLIGEETTAAFGVTELTDDPTWIVDPLDGTTNFVHG